MHITDIMVGKNSKEESFMYAKIEITGEIEIVTGMHIGGSSAFSAIGAVDSPVVRDVRTNAPMIPGTSFKGKMRALLAKKYNEVPELSEKPDDDHECLIRIFGSAKKGALKRGRIIFSDMFIKNREELRAQGVNTITEVKFENSINRLTAVANPRQIERVIRGTVFELQMIYEVEKEDEIIEDFDIIADGMKLLQYDYLGGSGTRGYGKIKFRNLQADTVVGEMNEDILEQCNEKLSQAER